MGRNADKSKREGVYVTQSGTEYVTVAVAAERIHRTVRAVYYQIHDNKLATRTFKDFGELTFVKWEKCRALFEGFSDTRNSDGSKKKVSLVNSSNFELKDLGNGELAPVEQKEMPSLVDVDDPENSDCWKIDNMGRPVKKNGHHVILYDKFKQKYDALIRKQQYEKEKGTLIPRDLVDTAFSKTLTPLINTINQIPDRYASRVVGFVESIMETKLDNSQTTSLRALLEDEAKAIIGQLKQNEEDALDGLLV